jgi:hypothetical protein
MSILCHIISHKWTACRCARCGTVRDEGHAWQGCKCSACGKTDDKELDIILRGGHAWQGCKCSACGKIQHSWRPGSLFGWWYGPCTKCGAPKPGDRLLRILESSGEYSKDWREAVSRPSAVADLVALLDHDSQFVRASAARALGPLGDRSVLPVLAERLNDINALVCQAAHKSVEQLGGRPHRVRHYDLNERRWKL